MKGYRFYLEYASPSDKRRGTVKNPGPHMGTVVALWLDDDGQPSWLPDLCSAECAASVYNRPNGPVGGTSVGDEYLRLRCRRIPERLAREIHPALFAYLEG